MPSFCSNGLFIIFAFLQLLGYGFSLELRCYCNLPACVHTAYMCKSEMGCFQELPAEKSGLRSRAPRIGCLELWSRKRPFHCAGLKSSHADAALRPPLTTVPPVTVASGWNKGTTTKQRKKKLSFLRCCTEDMCNYVTQAEPELNISILKTEQDVSISVQGSDSFNEAGVESKSDGRNMSEKTWFRAAVIAVPVGGGIILLILIIMASTLLKSDWRKISDNDRLLPENAAGRPVKNNCCDGDAVLVSVAPEKIQPKCQKLIYAKPFPSYLRGQLRHYHSDTTLVVCSEKTKDRPATVFLPASF